MIHNAARYVSLRGIALVFFSVVAQAQPGPTNPIAATVHAEIVVTGIPGAGAIAQVGTFHKGGPLHDNPAFAATTQPGQALDRTRLFVASTSNFGAPLARPSEAPGSILSVNVSGGPVTIPPDFATGGGQISAAGGKVILYTAQSPAFLNGLNNPAAATNDRPAVSLPRSISFNNGFGRPWFANAPSGSAGDGTITVTDPSGIPLAGAPDPVAGGVFAGNLTNRGAASQGLTAAALATALITKSPDQSTRAVFFAALADGSVVQVHVQKGVDGLVPPGSFTPISVIDRDRAESSDPNAGDPRGDDLQLGAVPDLVRDGSTGQSDSRARYQRRKHGPAGSVSGEQLALRPISLAGQTNRYVAGSTGGCGAQFRQQHDTRRRLRPLRLEPR
jgi:hypothetical protein